MSMREVLIAVLAFGGAVTILVSMIGLVRLPDALCRAHALSKGMTLGISLLLCSLWLSLGTELAGFRIIAAILFQFLTIPVASHLLARVVVEQGYPRYGTTDVDIDRKNRSPASNEPS